MQLNRRRKPGLVPGFLVFKEQSIYKREAIFPPVAAGSRDSPEGVSACTRQAIIRRGHAFLASSQNLIVSALSAK